MPKQKEPEKIKIKLGANRRSAYTCRVVRSMATEATTLATVETIATEQSNTANDLVNEALLDVIKKYKKEPVSLIEAKRILEGGA